MHVFARWVYFLFSIQWLGKGLNLPAMLSNYSSGQLPDIPEERRRMTGNMGEGATGPAHNMAGWRLQHPIYQRLFFLSSPVHRAAPHTEGEGESHASPFQPCIFVLVNFPNKLQSCLRAAWVEFLPVLFSTFESCAKPTCI